MNSWYILYKNKEPETRFASIFTHNLHQKSPDYHIGKKGLIFGVWLKIRPTIFRPIRFFLPIRYIFVFLYQGWDDVSFHGSPQIPTPNIDALALSGVILNNYYVSPSSFATKCEIMTGKYATRLGKCLSFSSYCPLLLIIQKSLKHIVYFLCSNSIYGWNLELFSKKCP